MLPAIWTVKLSLRQARFPFFSSTENCSASAWSLKIGSFSFVYFFFWMGIGNLRRSSRWRDGAKLMGGSSRKASFLPRMGLKKLAHYLKGMGTGGVIQFAYVIVFVILEPGWRTWYPFTKSWKEKAQILSRNRTLFLSHCYAHDKNELFCKSAIFLLNYLSLDFHF